MRLQQPRTVYSSHDEIERNRQIELADLQNHKRGQDLTVAPGRLILADETSGTQYEVYVDNAALLIRELGGLAVTTDADILQAERVVLSTYGDTVSVAAKAKNLNKFGRTENADSGVVTTIAAFQGTVVNETFVSTNLIDSVVSSSTSDTTQTIRIEGHTIDGSGNLTFVIQDAILTGQTEVTLATPLARANRAYVKASGTFNTPQAALVGIVSVYVNTDGIASGVPSTAAATKILIEAGKTQSEKCATSVSSTDYWILTSLHATIEEQGPAAAADFYVETRDIVNGGAWLPLGVELSLNTAGQSSGSLEFRPFRIIPSNHDVRVMVVADTANTQVDAELEGYLAAVQ